MFRKNYLSSFLTIALFLIGSSAIFGQTQPVGGIVVLKGEGTKVTPVQGALVEVFRTDIKATLSTDTTDKKGAFSFAGLPLGGVYALSISGPGISPEIIPNIKPGMDRLNINVLAGDGKRWTEEEVRLAVANPAGTQESKEESAEAKKKREEYEKQVADIKSKNDKALKANQIVEAALKEGDAAFKSKNYDVAIAKFDEAYKADPEFIGSAPVMLNNKSLVLLSRATDTYNSSLKSTDAAAKAAAKESVKADLMEVVASTEKALEMLKTATSTDANIQKAYDGNKFAALVSRKNAYRLMSQTGVERTKGKESLVAFQEYLAVESLAEKKSRAQLDLALTLQDSNEFELAIVEFQKIVDADPNNVDALAGLGLSLVNVGYGNLEADPPKGKTQLQEGSNYLQKFVDLAPDTHKLKEEMKGIIASLKEEQKVVPQKGKTTTTTKKKS